MENAIKFSSSDFNEFRNWLNLKIEDITWQGRFIHEFEDFWGIFFVDNITVYEILERFKFITAKAKVGPLNSWLIWLRNKFICFVFINCDVSVYQLSVFANMKVNELATLLRDFFLERYPYLEERLSDCFQISYTSCEKAQLKFVSLKKELHIEDVTIGSHDDEIMPTLEITLYEDWRDLLKQIKKQFKISKKFSFRSSSSDSRANFFYHLKAFLIVLIIFVATFFGLKYLNLSYEKILLDKVSIYEPKLKWLDKNLLFREPVAFETSESISIDLDELDKKNSKTQIIETIERTGTESDVVLSSYNEGPASFGNVDTEISDFEEKTETGVRDYRYGRNIVYRVLLRSQDIYGAKSSLNKVLQKYETSQVDNVKPGQVVPGGLYYNLYLPQESVRRFISEVMMNKKGIVYESRTRQKNPEGKGESLYG